MLETHPEPAMAECDLLRAHGANKGTSPLRHKAAAARACAFRYSTSFSPAYVCMHSLKGKEDYTLVLWPAVPLLPCCHDFGNNV